MRQTLNMRISRVCVRYDCACICVYYCVFVFVCACMLGDCAFVMYVFIFVRLQIC